MSTLPSFIELDLNKTVVAILFLGAEIGWKCYQGNPHGSWPTGQGARAGCELNGEKKHQC
jgi:hypothetical protein